MYILTGPIGAGRRLATLAAALLLAVMATNLNAETVKTVNGVDIDSGVFNFYLKSRTQKNADQVTAAERAVLLDELTDIYLLSTGAAADEVANDPELKAQIELQRRGVIAQTMAARFFDKAEVTEEEILASYDTQAALAPPLQFKARHILLESQGEAITVIADLEIGGNFEELAKERSTGPSGPTGGDIGWFSPGQMVAAFTNAVEALEDGEYTKVPVQTEFGWHVILREESRKAEAPTLDSVREVIIQNLQQEKFKVYLDELRTKSAG